MNLHRCVLQAGMLIGLIASPLVGQEGLPNLEQATEISQQSGRPILAMAGQET